MGFGCFCSNAQQLTMLGKSALRRIENYIFLMNFGGARVSEVGSHAL